MTSQSPRIYIYKITFEEVLYYYYGVHKEKKFGEYYMGSPVTHKWCWDFYTPKKQILEIFPFTDGGWIEAQELEKRLISPFYNRDKWCLNESCGFKSSLKILKESGKKGAERARKLNVGIFAQTKEQKSKNGKKVKELGIGIFSLTTEQRRENGKKYGSNAGKIGGKKAKELGVGVHGLTREQRRENSKKSASKAGRMGGQKTYELGIGIHGLTPEQRSENSKKNVKKMNSQKWMCTETGFITTPGPLTIYQKAKGIDTSKRKKIQ